jgi:ABC-type phosphate/phosphonate transport system permease subunit
MWKIGMHPETRQTVVNMAMVAAAFAVVTAVILMRPAARAIRPDVAAQSAALSALHGPASR